MIIVLLLDVLVALEFGVIIVTDGTGAFVKFTVIVSPPGKPPTLNKYAPSSNSVIATKPEEAPVAVKMK